MLDLLPVETERVKKFFSLVHVCQFLIGIIIPSESLYRHSFQQLSHTDACMHVNVT